MYSFIKIKKKSVCWCVQVCHDQSKCVCMCVYVCACVCVSQCVRQHNTMCVGMSPTYTFCTIQFIFTCIYLVNKDYNMHALSCFTSKPSFNFFGQIKTIKVNVSSYKYNTVLVYVIYFIICIQNSDQ